MGHHLPDADRRRLTARPVGGDRAGDGCPEPRRGAGTTDPNSACERDTGERRDAGAGTAWSRSNGRHLPDRGQAATSRRRGQLATTPANAARANVGPRGRRTGLAATSAGREGGTGERRDAGRAWRPRGAPAGPRRHRHVVGGVWPNGCMGSRWPAPAERRPSDDAHKWSPKRKPI